MLSVKGVYEKGEVKLKEKIAADVEREIPVIVTFLEDIKKTKKPIKKYRVSDLAGRLEWDGDAVAQQRAIRDEW
jgi:hypothetical protein